MIFAVFDVLVLETETENPTEGNGKPLLYFAKTTMLVQNKWDCSGMIWSPLANVVNDDNAP